MRESYEELRSALQNARESVVQLVMRRNYLLDEVSKNERLIADLETKAALAEKIKNPDIAAELRKERDTRIAELERLRALLNQAEVEAEAAKTNLPEEEARLTRMARDLDAQFVEAAGAHIENTSVGSGGSEADSLWERANSKIRGLEREASARSEVAASQAGQPSAAANRLRPTDPMAHEQTAEEMLTALEARLAPVSTEQNAISPPPVTESRPPEPAIEKIWNVHPTVQGEPSRMEPIKRVRVAGIGTGGIFRGAHLPCYPEIPQAQLVAFCDPDPVALDLAYKRYQSLIEAKVKTALDNHDQETADRLERDLETVQKCDDISEVIETVKPDMVDICTQPFLHTPLSIQALEAGIHVMCEKPISRSWLETERLIAAIKRTGKLYQHNENWLWDKDYYTAKKLVDAKTIGEPLLMFLAQAHGGPEGNPKFWNPDFGGGGALLDNGIHAIGAAWFVCGMDKVPTMVKAAEPFGMSIRMPERIIDGRFQKITVDDDAHILIRFEDKNSGAWTSAHIEGSWSERDSPDTAIIGSTGKIEFKNEDNRRFAIVTDSYGREQRRMQVSGPTWQHWPSSHYGEILNFIECVRYNVESICTAEFGADNSAIVGATYLSEGDNKRAKTLDEFKAFAHGIAEKYPNDPKAADDALVDALLASVRNKK